MYILYTYMYYMCQVRNSGNLPYFLIDFNIMLRALNFNPLMKILRGGKLRGGKS